jgi:integrase
MKGSIHYRRDRKRWFVLWWHEEKGYKLYKYNGEYLYDERLARKLLACMQADEEKGTFRIERYLHQATDVIPYLKSWLDIVQPHLSPATYKDYHNSIHNHLIPWFEHNSYNLHELQYDVLCRLLNGIRREGKGKLNVMYCLRKCLDFAHKSGRIQSMPPFPERSMYGIVEPDIKWVSEERQIRIIQAIPEIHQPIFWWLKYHLRRPSEAMALQKTDYDEYNDVFIIRRAFSNKKLIERTKTKQIHIIPCHPAFKPIMEKMPLTFETFFFVNHNGRLKGRHYQHDYLVDLWNRACSKVGENIEMYSGLKHSSCSQYINEKGLSIDELQMITDHARRESVLKYAKVQTETKRRLMMGKVITIPKLSPGKKEAENI